MIAYQVVNYIKKNLKQQDIHHSWSTIVKKMKSMQSSVVTVNNDKKEKVYIKLCTRPSNDQKVIFDALNFKYRPFTKKNKSGDPNVKIETTTHCRSIICAMGFSSWVKSPISNLDI